MEILVNDEPFAMQGPTDQTVQALADEICNQHEGPGKQLVVTLRCDGEDVSPEQIDAVLAQTVSDFNQIEMQTRNTAALAVSTLEQTIQLMQTSVATCEQIADHLDAGQHAEALPQLQQAIDVWKQVQQSMQVCAQAIGADLDSLAVNGRTMPKILDDIKIQLSQLKDAMEQQDFVLVGDTLRYEFAGPLNDWLALLGELKQQAEGADAEA